MEVCDGVLLHDVADPVRLVERGLDEIVIDTKTVAVVVDRTVHLILV